MSSQLYSHLRLLFVTGLTDGPGMNGSVGKFYVMSPNFVDFLYKNVVPACFYGLVRVTDGDVNQLLNESVACLKAIQSARGNEELMSYLQNQFFVQHFADREGKKELMQALVDDDVKSVKSCLRSLLRLK